MGAWDLFDVQRKVVDCMLAMDNNIYVKWRNRLQGGTRYCGCAARVGASVRARSEERGRPGTPVLSFSYPKKNSSESQRAI